MCGIFGLVKHEECDISNKELINSVTKLFRFSETRGSEAAGIALNTGNSIEIFKQAGSPKDFVKSKKYKEIFNYSIKTYQENCTKTSSNKVSFAAIGHSRLVTNGYQSENINNQPVIVPGLVAIHNGIITNQKELWKQNTNCEKSTDLDTEIVLRILKNKIKNGFNLEGALKETYSEIQGTASMAIFFEQFKNILLTTNTGSLFYLIDSKKKLMIFASERFILNKFIQSRCLSFLNFKNKINQLNAYEALNLNLETHEFDLFSLKNSKVDFNYVNKVQDLKIKNIFNVITDHTKQVKNLKRCTKCVLPETYPFIEFDEKGVCRYCRRHQKIKVKGNLELKRQLSKYKSKDGSPDCIVALSGGRDSCYGLHYIKKELGMNPIAFTYDWGLVTDLARRNCARVCGKLGIEHIIRTPNIARKRKFVRQNVEAWLKRPELGMIPLFMAGDKAFYHHARQLKKETNIKLVFFCTGNMIENCPYKFGFSGIRDGESGNVLTKIKALDKLQLISYYLKHFLLNPSYFNSSLFDTAAAYWHTFVAKDDFLYLYKYIEWDEDQVVNTIVDEYDWEKSNDTKTTWRIGDGTASFYNYIYYTKAGFTEDDDMISNMIREGSITREEGLKRSIEFAKPRTASLLEYSQMIGLNYEETLTKINKSKKLF